MRCFRDSDVFVGAAVIEERSATGHREHALDKDHVRYLSVFLPLQFRPENRVIGAIQDLARIMAVKYRDASAINEGIVRTVIDENDSIGG